MPLEHAFRIAKKSIAKFKYKAIYINHITMNI